MLIPVLVITIIGISLEGEDQHPRCAFLVMIVQNENKASSHNTLLTMVQVLVVLVITAGLLMWGRIRSDVVALSTSPDGDHHSSGGAVRLLQTCGGHDRSDRISEYVLHESHTHDTQCDGDERRSIQLHGLREGRPTSPGNHPGGDGMADPSDLPAMRSRAVSTLALRSIGILSIPLSTKR